MENFQVDFELLYQKYSDDVYRFILMRVGNQQKAEDLTQDTFVRVYKNYQTFKGDSSVKTWLFSIARNVTVDYFRSKKLTFSLPNWIHTLSSHQQTPDEIVELGEEITWLYEHIRKLKKSYQEVIILRKIQEFSIEETAEILQWSVSKVKSTTHRAMAILRNELLEGSDEREKAIK